MLSAQGATGLGSARLEGRLAHPAPGRPSRQSPPKLKLPFRRLSVPNLPASISVCPAGLTGAHPRPRTSAIVGSAGNKSSKRSFRAGID